MTYVNDISSYTGDFLFFSVSPLWVNVSYDGVACNWSGGVGLL